MLRNINQNLPGTRDANGPLPYPTFGNVQWREMTGTGNYQRHRPVVREAIQHAATAIAASYTLGKAIDRRRSI